MLTKFFKTNLNGLGYIIQCTYTQNMNKQDYCDSELGCLLQ